MRLTAPLSPAVHLGARKILAISTRYGKTPEEDDLPVVSGYPPPAQVAGVQELVVVAPPTPFGAYNADMLATCHELGIKEVYRMGGAQAVAAMAFGGGPIKAISFSASALAKLSRSDRKP